MLEAEARGTKGQIAGGGGYGVPKDKLLEVEAMGYQRTNCCRWRLGVPKVSEFKHRISLRPAHALIAAHNGLVIKLYALRLT